MIEAIAPTSPTPVNPSSAAGGIGASPRAGAAGGTAEPRGADFAAILGQVAADTSSTLKAAEAVSIAGVRGQASVQQVVDAVMAAEQTLHSAIAIRDKVVSAYLEVSRMQI